MPPEYEGAYIRLLAYCWANNGLPDDESKLAVYSRLGERWFNGGSSALKVQFNCTLNGRLWNKRLLEEKEKYDAWVNRSSEGGKKSRQVHLNYTSSATEVSHRSEVRSQKSDLEKDLNISKSHFDESKTDSPNNPFAEIRNYYNEKLKSHNAKIPVKWDIATKKIREALETFTPDECKALIDLGFEGRQESSGFNTIRPSHRIDVIFSAKNIDAFSVERGTSARLRERDGF